MKVREKLLEILKEINPDINYETEKLLIDDGIFDSLEVMSIVVEISDRLNVDIDPDDVTADNFNSIENMEKLVENSR